MSVLPTNKTTIERCEQKSVHTQTMIRKFSSVVALNGLADKLETGTTNLLAKHEDYRAKIKQLIVLRVEVKYTDYISDHAVRLGLKRAEIADADAGAAAGAEGSGARIVKTLFPDGITPIIKPVGGTQVVEMRALEGRYEEVAPLFADAAAERVKIRDLRVRYEDALKARNTGMDIVAQARAGRNLAKEEFLDVFAEVANRIKAAFPRDRKMQDLFFLKDKAASTIEGGGDEETDADDSDGEQG